MGVDDELTKLGQSFKKEKSTKLTDLKSTNNE